ncbi:MAG TPA: hypothetical protein H9996_04340 [Candidatus Faecalibacterium avium]|uniref:hypothetical protein n=1 Tax=Faecalibacterium sp. An121 TaxID=1965550 RepID=UPI000B381AE6|nr:hypothetical protein [Faecalibacterium sp. An121]OUQ36524.1 hypothetical protein B5E66_10285 [Faecalibacterium sp. An121]HIV43420.1 hypothetical protein [Candidatus Faecalibacterium avium]
MKQKIRYPEHFAPIAEDEMVYLNGGSLFEDVGNAVDDAVDATNKTLGTLGTVASVVGVVVLGASYIWGLQQANRWLDNNADGNIFTILGRAVDDLGADMSKSVSYFARDLVAAGMVVALWPISIPVLLII